MLQLKTGSHSSIVGMPSEKELKDIPSGILYWYGLWGGALGYFIPNEATFQQMKSSCSLSYFEKTIDYEAANYDRLTLGHYFPFSTKA